MTRILILAAIALPLAACATQQQRGYDDPYGYGDPMQANGERPFTYSAVGANWTMRIDNQTMQLTTNQGFSATDRLLSFTPNRETGDVFQGEDMTVVATYGGCTIEQTGQTYEQQVEVTIGGQTYRGCGGTDTLQQQRY